MSCQSFSMAAASSSSGKIFFAQGALGMAAMDHWTRSFMVYSRHGAMNLRCAAFTRLIFAPSRPA